MVLNTTAHIVIPVAIVGDISRIKSVLGQFECLHLGISWTKQTFMQSHVCSSSKKT